MTSSGQSKKGRNHHRRGHNRHSRRDVQPGRPNSVAPPSRGMNITREQECQAGGMRDPENLHGDGLDGGGGLDYGSRRQYRSAVAEVDELPNLDSFNTAEGKLTQTEHGWSTFDLSSPGGLDRGARLGSVRSGLIDLVVKPPVRTPPRSCSVTRAGEYREGAGEGCWAYFGTP